jgi:HSP20 family molecular chaperone IbpA
MRRDRSAFPEALRRCPPTEAHRIGVSGTVPQPRLDFVRERNRAFELFQLRGGEHGLDLDDWFKAENKLLIVPEGDITEKDGSFELKLAIPGFEEKELKVTALPDTLVAAA